MPDDFAYVWESVGAGHRCSMCISEQPQRHAWRAHSERYGDIYVCPRHLHLMSTMYGGERSVVWLYLTRTRKEGKKP